MSLEAYTNLTTQDLGVITLILQEKARVTAEHQAVIDELKKQHALELAGKKVTVEAITKLAIKNAKLITQNAKLVAENAKLMTEHVRLATELTAKNNENANLSNRLSSIASQNKAPIPQPAFVRDYQYDDDSSYQTDDD